MFDSEQDYLNWKAAACRLGGGIAPSMEQLEYWAAVFRKSVAWSRAERSTATHADCMELARWSEAI